MASVNNFLQHFNFKRLFDSEQNGYNKRYKTIAYHITSFLLWILLIPLKILDLIGFFYALDAIRRLCIKSRKLSDFEKTELQKVFKNTINWEAIRICENSYFAKVGAKKAGKIHLGFVLFRTINFSRPLDHICGISDMAWLVHEVTHVVQFKQIGVAYIFDALRAQRYGGYNYGGIKQLKIGKPLTFYNLEQQADIARDYYRAIISESSNSAIYKPYAEQIIR